MSQKFDETLYADFGLRFQAKTVITEHHSDHQSLVLFDNETFGKVLMLDGVTQVTTADEFIYHEMMAHVPVLAHGAAKNILIVGGGDGGIARQVLDHTSVERLDMVEIDADVVQFSKRHFESFNQGAFDDPRFHLAIDDGLAYVAKTDRRYDVIIVDSTDPEGPGAALFTAPFYADCARILNDGGILVTQNGVPFLQSDELVNSISLFNRYFADATCYVAAIPTYIGGHMALGWASKSSKARSVDEGTLIKRFGEANITTKYYTPQVHRAAFALPKFIADLVESGYQK